MSSEGEEVKTEQRTPNLQASRTTTYLGSDGNNLVTNRRARNRILDTPVDNLEDSSSSKIAFKLSMHLCYGSQLAK